MLNEKKLMKLGNIFANFKEIKAAYLFGSYVENKENNLSDLDIGILLNEGYSNMIKLNILTKLTENNFDNVDLVILNNAPPLTQFEVVKHNNLIYQQENFDVPGFYSKVVRTFLDFKPYLEVQRSYLKERVLNG